MPQHHSTSVLHLAMLLTLASIASACGVPEGDVKSTIATVHIERDGVQYDHYIYEDLSAATTLRQSFEEGGELTQGPVFSSAYDEAEYRRLTEKLRALDASGFQDTHAPNCTFSHKVNVLDPGGARVAMRYDSCQDDDQNELTILLEDIVFDAFAHGETNASGRRTLDERDWAITPPASE